jgi:hypothetical protein
MSEWRGGVRSRRRWITPQFAEVWQWQIDPALSARYYYLRLTNLPTCSSLFDNCFQPSLSLSSID